MAHFYQELEFHEQVKEKARNDIGETTEYLEAPNGNYHTSRDIWIRLTRELAKLEGFEQSMIALKGRELTAIVAHGLHNACAISKLTNK
jgi:hypothetical protein